LANNGAVLGLGWGMAADAGESGGWPEDADALKLVRVVRKRVVATCSGPGVRYEEGLGDGQAALSPISKFKVQSAVPANSLLNTFWSLLRIKRPCPV